MHRQSERQTDRQTDRKTDGQDDLLWFFDGDVRAEFPIFNDDRDPIESPTARADDPPSDTNPNIQSRIGDNLMMIFK